MRCSKARKLIPRYVDSELDESTARAVCGHIEACAACRADEAELRSALSLLDEWAPADPKLGFEALLSRIDHRHRWPAEQTAPLLGVPSWAVAALAAISIAGGAVLGVTTPGTPPKQVISEQQVAGAIALHSFDDVVAASFAYGLEANEAQQVEKEAAR